MLEAGIPLLRALEALETSPEGTGPAAAGVGELLHRGTELETAFARTSSCFEKLTLGLIKLGRKTGSLVEVMARLAERIEERCRRQEQLRASLAYPIGILSVATVCCLALAWVLLPQLAAVLQSLGSEPPLPTRLLLAFASYRALVVNAVALPMVVLAFWHRFRNKELRRWWDAAVRRIPVFGAIRAIQGQVELAQDLSLALHAGLPLAESFLLMAETSADRELRAALIRVGRGLSGGAELSECLATEAKLGELLRQSLIVGMETGQTVSLLEAAARSLDEELVYRINRAVALLEPSVMLLLGLVTGFVVLASLLPLYRVASFS